MALSDQQFNQFLLDAEDSTGFGINRYNELKELGATNQQIAEIAANAPVVGPKAKESLPELKDIYYTRIRGELETQYNNIVSIGRAQGKDTTYRGRSSDLPTIFNQQARQLADGGLSSISNLRNQDGRLVDISTGQQFTNTNLGGAVAIDRDTGAQKFGDIFSGVKGGANYGIQFASDGSPILFPVWEKTKSPIAQVGLEFLEPVIEPIATAAGYYFGGPILGTAVGNTVGQYLASGEVDAERVAIATATAYAGSEIAGSMGGEAAGTGLTPGTSGEGFTAAGSTGFTAPPNYVIAPEIGASIAATTPSLLGPSETDLLGTTDFSRTGETGLTPGTSGEGFVAAPGAAPGLSSMGGGTGLTVPVAGGTVAQGGFVPATQAPALGGGSEFGATDALRLANQAQSLFGQQPQMGGLLGGQRGGGQPMGVDYSGLLALLQARTGTPNVASLLAPAVNRYQPLTTQQSLLG